MLERALGLFLVLFAISGCAFSSHETRKGGLGTPRPAAAMLAVVDAPGPVAVETVNSADWAIDRGGLVNLDHPRARQVGLGHGDEPIQIYFHAIRHPTRGMFIVDTGVERALRDDPSKAALRGIVASFMHREKMKFHMPLGDWLAAQKEPLRGVFFTHLHLDHVSGLPDVPRGTPIYAGPGETSDRAFLNVFVKPNIDRALEGQVPIEEWPFAPEDGRVGDAGFRGVVDIFDDGSFWAIWMPGHTPGSTAYLARTASGSILLTGDTCHTTWGWDHDVEPGSFTSDHVANADSLARLRRLVREHPNIDVRLGHQSLSAAH
jgi:N-acyl homoserine lactone hydrolase